MIIMNALREIVTSKNGLLSIRIPKEYTQRQFEVIVIPIEESSETTIIKAKMNAFIKSLPLHEPTITESDVLDEIQTVRHNRYAQKQN
jgi:hypothetical protein